MSASEPETVTPVSVEDTDTLHITATEEQQPHAAEEKAAHQKEIHRHLSFRSPPTETLGQSFDG